MKTVQLCIALALSLLAFTVSANIHKAPTGSIIWKVSGNGLSEPSYILGTHHVIPIKDVESVPGVQEAINNTKRVVGEVVMQDMYDNMSLISTELIMPEGFTYRELLSEEDYNLLDEEVKNMMGVGLDQLGNMKPVGISSMYAVLAYQKHRPEIDLANFEPIDGYLQRMALENGKQVIGLETVQDQIEALYNSRSIQEQADELICVVKNKEYTFQTQIELEKYYLAGDLEKISKIMDLEDDPCSASDEYKSQINKNRNDNWMKKLPTIIQEKSSLIVVGCLHIAGEDGILYQLQELGYTVTPVLE